MCDINIICTIYVCTNNIYGMIYWIWYLPTYNSVHCKYKQQCTLHMYVSCIIGGLDLHYLHVWNIWYVLPIILVKLFLVSS